ncbi:MAG: DUF4352 domain-containing protein [Chloroflexota bacterium]
MSQSWGPPDNEGSPSAPADPQYQLIIPDNNDYIYQRRDTTVKRSLFFVAGGCSTLLGGCSTVLLIGMCISMAGVLWFLGTQIGFSSGPFFQPGFDNGGISQPAPGVVSPTATFVSQVPAQTQPVQQQPTATPFDPNIPVAIGQPVQASDVGVELTVWDIQRNVQTNNFRPADGLEFLSVSIQLSNVGAASASGYQVGNFYLIDAEDTSFFPHEQADNGRRLVDGQVEPGSLIEGDLLFYVPLGHAPLTLVWQAPGSQLSLSVNLQ